MKTGSRIVGDFFRKNWLRYAAGVLLSVACTYATASIPNLTGETIDALKAGESAAAVQAAIAIGAMGVLAFVLRFVWRYLIMGFNRMIELTLREALFAHLQRLTAGFYNKNNTGDLISRSIVDIQAVRMMFGFAVVGIIDALTTTAVSLYYMLTTADVKLTLMVAIPLPLVFALLVWLRLVVRRRFNDVQAAIADISSRVQENVTGIRVVKAFAQERSESGRFEELSRKKWKAEMRMVRVSSVLQPIVDIVFGVVFVVFLIVGAGLVRDGEISLGSYMAFNSYVLLIVSPITRVSMVVVRWQRGVAALERINRIMRAEPEINEDCADRSLTELSRGEIRIEHLSFSYEPGRPVLKGIALRLEPGRTLALMGPTGCGKTTLANLIARSYETEGCIYIDGRELREIPLDTLRAGMACVPQDTFLFTDSILENIRFCDPSITDEEVYEAARSACIYDNIMEFPDGFSTKVGERGMTLSGGQKQRVALARALVRKPRILILDDCMSAVDAETETAILSNLKALTGQSTTVMITHRISASRLCDEVLLLSEDGAVLEYGPHAELEAAGGAYHELCEAYDKLGREGDGK